MKTAVRQKDATGSVLQRAAKAVGSAMGTLVATTGITDAKDFPKMTAIAIRTTQQALLSPLKKQARKAATRRNPAMKPDRGRKTKDSPAVCRLPGRKAI
jgi:hypothetical protein